jgi:hypothetical protein
MYAWGGSTSNWKKPSGYSFDSARKPYLDKLAKDASKKGARTYTHRSSPNMKLVDPMGKTISSNSENPIVIGVDVTGSMCTWPAEIFDRLPLLYQTLSQYRDDVDICFAAIGDANSDAFPLQVNDFGKGVGLEDKLKALYPEGGGGGQISESYELFAYFMLEHCNLAKAKSPFLLVYGDEKFYNEVNPAMVKHYIGDDLQAELDANNVWKKLMQKFNVYFLQKAYGNENEPRIDAEVNEHWSDAIGKQKIIKLPSRERAVDIAIGLIAKQWGEFDDFTKNITSRQDEEEADKVYSSIRHIPVKASSKSMTVASKSKKTMKTKPLI